MDTVAPVVTIDSIGIGGVIQDNVSAADHTISGTGEVGRLVKLAFPTDDDPDVSHLVSTMVGKDGQWSYTLTNDDMIVIGQGAGRSVVATSGRCRGERVLHSVGRVRDVHRDPDGRRRSARRVAADCEPGTPRHGRGRDGHHQRRGYPDRYQRHGRPVRLLQRRPVPGRFRYDYGRRRHHGAVGIHGPRW